jgi:hypothetical protein
MSFGKKLNNINLDHLFVRWSFFCNADLINLIFAGDRTCLFLIKKIV